MYKGIQGLGTLLQHFKNAKVDKTSLKTINGQSIEGEGNIEVTGSGNGLSAYEVAVANGFVGTEAAWLLSLKGEPGAQGPAGAKGEPGNQGPQGPKGDPATGITQQQIEGL